MARTTTVSKPAEDEPVVDSGNQPASPSDAEEEVTEEIEDEDVPLALEPEDKETIVTTVEQETISVTWNSDQEYKSDENGQFIYTAEISEDYILADGVKLPQVYVLVGMQTRDARAAATISVTINGTEYAGSTLQDAISKLQGGATAVTSLKITAGEVTEADWEYLTNLSKMTTFEIDSSIETAKVANIPDSDRRTFPLSIVSATVPQAITIGDKAFITCTALKTANFPEATSIGEFTFGGCTALTDATFPVAASIGNGSFSVCTKLTNVSFPMATSIGTNGFSGCTALATLNLGATPPSVGTDAFANCPATRALGYVAADGTAFTDNALTAAQAEYKAKDDGNTGDGLWYGWAIGAAATATISVTINGTEYAGSTLQDAISKLQGGAIAVTSLKITAGKVTTDDWNYLKSLTAMTTFEIAGGVMVDNIPDSSSNTTFPTNIETVKVPQAITIGNMAFDTCKALTSVDFPEATTLGTRAFNGCTALTSASFPAATSIGVDAFAACKALTSASFPVLTDIGQEAFFRCYDLTSASFPAVTNIGKSAFNNCTALTSATFPAVTGIEQEAFKDCSKLATLKLGATPPPTVVDNAFDGCPETRALGYVDASGTALTGDALTTTQAAYKAKDDGNIADGLWYGWTIESAATATISVTINGTEYAGSSLQDAISKLQGGFDVTSLNITAGEVITADWEYLKNLDALTTFEIDAAVETVADIPDGISGSAGDIPIFPTSIVTVTVPQAIVIGGLAFSGCSALTSASFPALTTIGEESFASCTSLATLTLGATPPTTVGTDAFKDCPATRALGYVAADGTPLADSALTTAQETYTSYNDGNTTDNLWYGWAIGAVLPPAPPAPPSGGGGGGSSSSQTIYTSVPPKYTGGTKNIGNVRVPDYTVEGAWKKNANGTWNFSGKEGQTYANSWAPVFNPYADVTKGQSAFDWFKFDSSGNMITGWHTDTDGNTYYLNPNSDNTLGAMKTGWVLIDGKYYYFNEMPDGTRGKLFQNTRTPDGYLVDQNGVWDGIKKQ